MSTLPNREIAAVGESVTLGGPFAFQLVQMLHAEMKAARENGAHFPRWKEQILLGALPAADAWYVRAVASESGSNAASARSAHADSSVVHTSEILNASEAATLLGFRTSRRVGQLVSEGRLAALRRDPWLFDRAVVLAYGKSVAAE